MISKGTQILHLTPRYFPSLGGVEKHVSAVSRELVKQGYKVRIVTTQHERRLPLHETLDGIEVFRIPYSSIADKRLTWQWIREHKNIFNVPFVQVHDVGWWLLPLFPQLIKKYFITFHGWEGEYPVLLKNKLQRLFFAIFSKGVMHVGAFIQEFYYDKPDLVVYGGVSESKTVRSRKKPSKVLNCTFVGRLEAVNEIEKYLRLLDLLNKKNIPVQMTWVGDGSYRDVCQQYGKVTGMVRDVDTHIGQTDIVFSASYLSILEAQRKRKIVCSFYSNLLKESYLKTFPGAGWMLITDDPAQMAKLVADVFADHTKREKLQDGAQKFAQKQTWENLTNQYLSLWSK